MDRARQREERHLGPRRAHADPAGPQVDRGVHLSEHLAEVRGGVPPASQIPARSGALAGLREPELSKTQDGSGLGGWGAPGSCCLPISTEIFLSGFPSAHQYHVTLAKEEETGALCLPYPLILGLEELII